MNYIYIKNKNSIMKFLEEKIHKDDIILIKCSNSTEVNKFVKLLLKRKIDLIKYIAYEYQ